MEMGNQSFPVYNLDLHNQKELSTIFDRHSIDAVIHLAGYKSVRDSTIDPINYYWNNIVSTLTLLEVMQMQDVYKLVFSSSATVYKASDKMPITEDYPLEACNPYGRTKLIIEQLLKDVHDSDPNWHITILRYFNPIGAHKSGRIGEDSNGTPNNLVPYLSNVAIGNYPKLYIFGNDYPTKDGTGVRDYIHVVDLAKGHIRALSRMEDMKGLEVFNLGTGTGYSVLELVKAFSQVSKKEIAYTITSRRNGDVAECYADVTKANNQLGWQAEKDIHEMCQDAWRWQQQNPNGY